MERTCSLETMVHEKTDRKAPDDELGEALRNAVSSTRAKIDEAFGPRQKIAARLKSA
jgi:hypothetical protein